MPNVNDTVRNLITTNPALYPSRGEALHHIFCVIGSGFAWDEKTGEVVEDTTYHTVPYVQVSFNPHMVHLYGPNWASRLDEEMVDKAFTYWETQKFTVERVLHDLPKAVNTWEPFDAYNVYPQSEYCVLSAPTPVNATQDWLDAAEEVRQVVTQYGWKI